MPRASALVFGLTALLFIIGPYARLKGEADDSESLAAEEREATSRMIREELPNWKLWADNDRDRELTLESKPVLRWTNPGVGRVYGDVYVWTHKGRPEAVISFYKGWKPVYSFTAEMHSLSLGRLTGQRAGVRLWQTEQPGVTLKDVPDSPKPADTARRRLQQMRTLAGDFSAKLVDRRLNLDGEQQELRLLTQPLYRYEADGEELLDGALFAIVLGTDPEVFLLLEARQKQGTHKWQFGLARMNMDPIVVSFKDREVWRVEKGTFQGPPEDVYRVQNQLPFGP